MMTGDLRRSNIDRYRVRPRRQIDDPRIKPLGHHEIADIGELVALGIGRSGNVDVSRHGSLRPHYFSAPAVNPETILFCSSKKTTRIGSTNTDENAITRCQSAYSAPTKL